MLRKSGYALIGAVIAGITVCTVMRTSEAVTINFRDDGTFTAPSYSEPGLTVSAPSGVGLLTNNGIGVVGGISDILVEAGETLTFDFDFSVVNIVANFVPSVSNFILEYEAFNGVISLGTVQNNALFNPAPFVLDISDLFLDQPITSFTVTGIGGAAPGQDFGAISFDEAGTVIAVAEPTSLALLGLGLLGLGGVVRVRSQQRQS